LYQKRNQEYDTFRQMSPDFYSKVTQLSSQGIPFAVATVVRVQGSSSARRGSKAIITAQGKMVMGWVGGGCAESAVRNVALRCIEKETSELITLDMQDEVLGVGMPCGGMMDIFIEPVLPRPELLIVGHGRIAETLSRLAHLMGFSVVVNDPGADRESFPDAQRLVTTDFDLSETPIHQGTYVVIATLHKNDHLWLEKALSSKAFYIALVASQHRARIVFDYVVAAGVPAEKLERVWAPAGLDLGAVTPEEIALSIMGQIVAVRRGGSPTPSRSIEKFAARETDLAVDHVIRQCDGD
jgi:xanthine dehydrogenase accessory factor